MSKWEFYDKNDGVDLSNDEQEFNISFYEFKKWLNSQKEIIVNENFQREEVIDKEEAKKQFKKAMTDKVQKKIENKMKKKK